MNKKLEWILSRDAGVSSKTIWTVMMGVITTETRCDGTYDTPSDHSDFGRCHRLLELIPEWRDRMDKVAEFLPAWRPMVREWPEMTRLYLRDLQSGTCGELYKLMKKLRDDGMILDGWKKKGECSWTRDESEQIVRLEKGVTISTR